MDKFKEDEIPQGTTEYVICWNSVVATVMVVKLRQKLREFHHSYVV
jgi:hypothetical protein